MGHGVSKVVHFFASVFRLLGSVFSLAFIAAVVGNGVDDLLEGDTHMKGETGLASQCLYCYRAPFN